MSKGLRITYDDAYLIDGARTPSSTIAAHWPIYLLST